MGVRIDFRPKVFSSTEANEQMLSTEAVPVKHSEMADFVVAYDSLINNLQELHNYSLAILVITICFVVCVVCHCSFKCLRYLRLKIRSTNTHVENPIAMSALQQSSSSVQFSQVRPPRPIPPAPKTLSSSKYFR